MSPPKLFIVRKLLRLYVYSFVLLRNLSLSISLILLSSLLASSVNVFSGIASLIVNFRLLGFKTSKDSTCFFPCSSIVFICFSNAIPSGKYVNLACSIVRLDQMAMFLYL